MNKSLYKVSICVPVYGVENYIERCAISLLEQTYENLELIFVDDCSPDNSISLLLNVINRYPARKGQTCIIRHSHNRGLAAARNTAVASATGDFILHVDSDDFLDRSAVEKFADEQVRSGADIVTSGYIQIISNHKSRTCRPKYLPSDKLFNEILSRNVPMVIWGRLIRRSLYTDHNIKVEAGASMGEDYQTISRLLFFSRKVSYVDDALYVYNCINQNSYTFSFKVKTAMQCWDSFFVVKNFLINNAPQKLDLYYNAELKQVVSDLKNSSKCKSKENYEYFVKMLDVLKHIDKNRYKILSLQEKVVLYIRNYTILHYLTWCVSIVKKCFGII